nr:beta-propeller fold lactonase family protein [Lysobacter sp. CAU 1642]
MSLILAPGAQAQILEFKSSISQLTRLAGLSHGAWSPGGQHLYVVADQDDTLVQFIPSADGSLAFGQVLRDGVAGVDGLEGAAAVAISPGGEHVYVASGEEDALAAFARDGASGELTPVEVLRDGIDGIDGLLGARFLLVSPDGAHVYVAGRDDDAIAVFSRNATTGALSFVEAFRRPADLGSPVQVAISPDGATLYAVGTSTSSLAVLERDAGTGALSFLQKFEAYLFGTQDPDEIAGMLNPTAVLVSGDGGQVYIASPIDDTVLRFDRDAATGMLTYADIIEDGTGGVTGLNGATYLSLSPDGAHLYVAARIDDAVTTLGRDAGTGALSFLATQNGGVAGLDFVETVLASPDGALVHGISGRDRSLVAFSRDGASGLLTYSAIREEPPTDVAGLDQIRSVAVDAGGTRIYTAGSRDNALGVFALDPGEQTLRFVEAQRNGVDGVRGLTSVNDVVVSPDRRHVYAVSPVEHVIATFNVIGIDGELQFDRTTSAPGMGGASALAMSADGRHLYVAGRSDDALVVFRRHEPSGHLRRLETHVNGENGLAGLVSPDTMAISPDGTLLLVAAAFSSQPVAFSRDPQTGRLLHEPVSMAKGFGSAARRIVFSPDGLHVLIATESPQRLLVLRIDFSTGALVLTEVQRLEDTGTGFSISEDGTTVTVTDADTASVQVFSRDPGSGLLSLVDTATHGQAGVSGVSDPAPVEDPPDSLAHVIVGDRDGSLALFATAAAPVPGAIDVRIDKYLSEAGGGASGGVAGFDIHVYNKRNDSSASVFLEDLLPAGALGGTWLVLDQNRSSLSTEDRGEGDLRLGFQLDPRGSGPQGLAFVHILYVIQVPPGLRYFNRATATAEGDINPKDNIAGHNNLPWPLLADGFEDFLDD